MGVLVSVLLHDSIGLLTATSTSLPRVAMQLVLRRPAIISRAGRLNAFSDCNGRVMFERSLCSHLLGENGVFGNLLFSSLRLVEMRIGRCVTGRLQERGKPPNVGRYTRTLVDGLRVSHNATIVNADHLHAFVASEETRIC